MRLKNIILCLLVLVVVAPAAAFAKTNFSFSLNLFNPCPIVRPCPPPVIVHPCYPCPAYHHHVWYYGPHYYPGYWR